MRTSALKKQSVYSQDPAQLTRQLAAFEKSVDEELRRLGATRTPNLTVRDVTRSNAQALMNDALRMDAGGSALEALLPSADPGDVSGWVGVIVTDATNNVTVRSVDNTVTVDGSATATLSTEGMFLFFWDGSGWWSAG